MMMVQNMRRQSGQEAIEFILITALVFFGAFFTVLIFGDKISAFFTEEKAAVQLTKNAAPNYNSSNEQKYTPDFETISVDNVDYSDVSLEVPPMSEENLSIALEDLREYMETAGSSGGTDVIIASVSQIAQQLEEQGLIAQSNKVKKLANIMHNVASVERMFEQSAKRCSNTAQGFKDCMRSLMSKDSQAPESFISSASSFNDGQNFDYLSRDLELAQHFKNYDKTCKESNSLGCSFAKTYGDILTDENIDKRTRRQIKQLAITVSNMSENMTTMVHWAGGDYEETQVNLHLSNDGYTMRQSTKYSDEYPFTYNDFQRYNISEMTDVDGLVTCLLGAGEDVNNRCH